VIRHTDDRRHPIGNSASSSLPLRQIATRTTFAAEKKEEDGVASKPFSKSLTPTLQLRCGNVPVYYERRCDSDTVREPVIVI
jgi:hypothetical protein